MEFPVALYHRSTEAYVLSGYASYPIVVGSQEELDALVPGWCADPNDAAAFVEGQSTDAQADAALLAAAYEREQAALEAEAAEFAAALRAADEQKAADDLKGKPKNALDAELRSQAELDAEAQVAREIDAIVAAEKAGK